MALDGPLFGEGLGVLAEGQRALDQARQVEQSEL
jgi:hypothetical protein